MNAMPVREDGWTIANPAAGIELRADQDGVWLRGGGRDLSDAVVVRSSQPTSNLGSVLPALIGQLLELGLATCEGGDIKIPHPDYATLSTREISAFDGVVAWAPYTMEIDSTGWLGGESFAYRYRFYLGTQVAHLSRIGCFVRRGDGPVSQLDAQTFALIDAIDAFNALPGARKADASAFVRFAEVKGLAAGVGAQLDRFLTEERVLVPPRVGLNLLTDEDGRVSFVPQIDGVDVERLGQVFLAQDDVDEVYAVDDERGGRVRVVLDDSQREVLRRMQRVRRLGGAERATVLRNPHAVFDGVASAVEIDPLTFGPRVKGIGDFPFAAQPFIRRDTGIFDDPDGLAGGFGPSFSAGIQCRYADERIENVQFESRQQIVEFHAAVEDAWRQGVGTVDLSGKSIVLDEPFVTAVRELRERVVPDPRQPSLDKPTRKYLLIYTNENELEYEEQSADAVDWAQPEIPRSLRSGANLKEHQLHGLAWLQRNFLMGRRGCLLADDMGMGKTLQVLTFLAWAIERNELSRGSVDPLCAPWDPILIVAPLVLIENGTWLDDMRTFFEGEGAVFQPWLTLHGAAVQKLRRDGADGRETVIGDAVLDLDKLQQNRMVLTNYETVTNYAYSFARMKAHWSIVVTDEAQEYKVPSTKISHAIKGLAPRFRIACTGTPVETRLLDVWNIFDCLQPGQLMGSAAEFSKNFERGSDERASENLAEIRTRLKFGTPEAFLLRRDKSRLADLPPKLEHELRCSLSVAQRQSHLELIGRVRQGGEGAHPFSVIHHLMRLYQHPALFPHYKAISAQEALSLCPKMAALIDCLRGIRAVNEKVLVFTRSLDMQQLLTQVLAEEFGLAVDVVNGASGHGGRGRRAELLRRFRGSEGFNVIILSPDVAGMGLTLTEANHVIHYGRWWNPAKEAQATDRAYRIGQTRPVHVYYPIAVDPLGQFETFDEKLHALILRRRALATEFLMPLPTEEDVQSELLNEVLSTTTPAPGDIPPMTEYVRRLSPERFEGLVALLEQREGRRVILTPRAANDGINVISIGGGTVRLIQCAHSAWGAKVQPERVKECAKAVAGFRSRRLGDLNATGRVSSVLVAAGMLGREAREAALATQTEVVSCEDLERRLSKDCGNATAIEAMLEERLGSMRDVEAILRSLFGVRPVAQPQRDASEAPTKDPRWIASLIGSARYLEQKESNRRIAPSNEKMCACLRALHERGDRITRTALAQRLGLDASRIQGLVASMRSVLNVEGYEILVVDIGSDTIELNRQLLHAQFELADES